MFENNSIRKSFKASEIKKVADDVVKSEQEQARRKEQAFLDRYSDWIVKWGISVEGAKTLESIMINIEDEGAHGHYMYTHYFRICQNNDEDIEIIKDILEDYGFNVVYELKDKTPWHKVIGKITWG